jgi:hypothetical protein
LEKDKQKKKDEKLSRTPARKTEKRDNNVRRSDRDPGLRISSLTDPKKDFVRLQHPHPG